MTLLINTLTDVINQIAKSAQLSTLVPATILVLCNLVFMFPALDIIIEDSTQVSLIVLVTITISYLLWLLNGPLIRLLEGYEFEETRLGLYMISRQRDRLKRLERNLEECQTQLQRANNWLENILPLRFENLSELQSDPEYEHLLRLRARWQAIELRDLEERTKHFPPASKPILPTRLGNTLIAFEYYPYLRYGINGPVLWPRLVHILDKNGFITYVEREKSAIDFLLNLIVITTVLGLECIGFAARFLQPVWLIGTAVAIAIVTVAYHTLIANAVYWGNMVKVAFDLYRHDLREALLVRKPDRLDDEKRLWENLSKFLAANQSPPPTIWDYSLLQKKEKSAEGRSNHV